MGLDELLRVLREEAANEERAAREGAAREAERIVEEARAAAGRARDAALAREAGERAARLRAVGDAVALERERALLVEARRQLDLLKAEALGALPTSVEAADVERFLAEVVEEAGPVTAILVVDPGRADTARRVLGRLGARPAPEIREADSVRGGVELITGALVLDDTAASRLERAWPRLEPELGRLLFGED